MALEKLIVAALLILSVASAAKAASSEALYAELNKLPPPQRQARLEEGARREGAFTYYSISAAELIAAYVKGFTARYPFIKAEFYRGSGNQLVVRTMMEHKTGRLAADVISVGTENVMALKRSGIWARYHSPEAENYPREQYDKDGYFHADSLGLATIAYNRELVKKEDAPKNYSDLLDPKWKGAVTIDLLPRPSGTMSGRAPGPAKRNEPETRGCSSMAERQLPKLIMRVRFPSPAPPAGSADRHQAESLPMIGTRLGGDPEDVDAV